MEGNDILYSEAGEALAQVGLRSCASSWIPEKVGKKREREKGKEKE